MMVTDKTKYRNLAKKVRKLRDEDEMSFVKIGVRFGVSQTTAARCYQGNHPKWFVVESAIREVEE